MRDEIISIELFWSVEDQEYVVRLKNQPGVSALKQTIRGALRSFADLLPTIVEMEGIRMLSQDAEQEAK